jgi:hypothetical protein
VSYPLGFISPSDRTREQAVAHDVAMAMMPDRFALTPTAAEPDPGPFVDLSALWKHERVKAALGFEWPGIRQITGSCVGAGGGNCLFTLSAFEVIRLADPEQIVVPFWLMPYGMSRYLLGDRSEGEGSLGSTFARAVKEYGTLRQDEPTLQLPAFEAGNGLSWGQRVELRWSNGAAFSPDVMTLAKRNLVQTTAPVKSAADARTALRNGYPLTFASPWFMTPGAERAHGSGADACVVGALSSSGGHQTSILATWDHPTAGLLFWNENQWGTSTYRACPKMGRGSGCWMTEKDMDRVCRSSQGEVFAFSQYQGFPAQSLPWADIMRW